MAVLISPCGGAGGACDGIIDSTAHAGATCGVHSTGAAAGDSLVSDGAGGSLWAAGSGYTPRSDEEYLNSGNFLVGIGATGNAVCALQAGSAIVSLATATRPSFLASGVWSVTATVIANTIATTNNLWTINLVIDQSSFLGVQTFSQYVYSPRLADVSQGCISWTGLCFAGDKFRIQATNLDSAARNFQLVTAAVTRVLEP